MRPIKELEKLRTADLLHDSFELNGTKQLITGTKQYEALVSFDGTDLEGSGIELTDSKDNNVLNLKYDQGKVILNRAGSDGEREALLPASKSLKFHLFVDTSSVEIFVNDGVRTFTERFYADEAKLNVVTKAETKVSADVYQLDKHAVKF